jgi:plastocyanin
MLTTSPTLGLGIKIIGLTAIATILLPASLSMGFQTSYGQFGAPTQQEPQEELQQVPSSPLTQQLQMPAQQQQLQDSQNQVASVSIVPGAASLTTDGYSPNPVQVSVGTTVTWTNDDAQPHTVTSGQNATPDGRFTSEILAPAATFDFTFTEAGKYPYFCVLHPNRVGTVSVS